MEGDRSPVKNADRSVAGGFASSSTIRDFFWCLPFPPVRCPHGAFIQEATRPTSIPAVTRIPRIQGLPPMIFGSSVMRSSVISTMIQRLRQSAGGRCLRSTGPHPGEQVDGRRWQEEGGWGPGTGQAKQRLAAVSGPGETAFEPSARAWENGGPKTRWPDDGMGTAEPGRRSRCTR